MSRASMRGVGKTGTLVIDCVRVSNKERAQKGYSAPGQLHALRERSAREGDEETRKLEEALARMAALTEEDLAAFEPKRRCEMYEAMGLDAVARGKTVRLDLSGVFCLEGSTSTRATGSWISTGA